MQALSYCRKRSDRPPSPRPAASTHGRTRASSEGFSAGPPTLRASGHLTAHLPRATQTLLSLGASHACPHGSFVFPHLNCRPFPAWPSLKGHAHSEGSPHPTPPLVTLCRRSPCAADLYVTGAFAAIPRSSSPLVNDSERCHSQPCTPQPPRSPVSVPPPPLPQGAMRRPALLLLAALLAFSTSHAVGKPGGAPGQPGGALMSEGELGGVRLAFCSRCGLVDVTQDDDRAARGCARQCGLPPPAAALRPPVRRLPVAPFPTPPSTPAHPSPLPPSARSRRRTAAHVARDRRGAQAGSRQRRDGGPWQRGAQAPPAERRPPRAHGPGETEGA